MSILSLLRQSTKIAHAHLDHHPLLQGLLNERVSLPVYVEALLGLHGAFNSLESAAMLGQGPAYVYQPRTPQLLADLRALGVDSFMPAMHERFPEPRSLGEKIGLLYVLEGSALGGQVIARQLRKVLGADIPCSFFGQVHPQQTEQRWQRFAEFAQCCPPEEADPAVRMARLAFSACREHLEGFAQLLEIELHL